MTLEEIIAALAAHDAKDVAKALQEHAQPYYQTIFNAGHPTATQAAKTRLETVEAELQAAREGVTQRESELAELRGKQPDLKKWQDEKEQALLKKEQEWREKYEGLEGKLKAKAADGFRASLVQKLIAEGVDPWAAERAVTADVLKRVQADAEGGIKVYQADGATPIAAAEGQDIAALLAKEVASSVPEHFRTRINGQSGYKPAVSGAGRTFTKEEIGKMTPQEYEKHAPEIDAALKEGRIQ